MKIEITNKNTEHPVIYHDGNKVRCSCGREPAKQTTKIVSYHSSHTYVCSCGAEATIDYWYDE